MGAPNLPDLTFLIVLALIGFIVSAAGTLWCLWFVGRLLWEGGKVVFG